MSSQHHDLTRLTFELPAVDHKKLKAIAALAGISLKELILTCLNDNLLSENIPNEETAKVFKATDERKNLIQFKNVNDLINTFGL